MWKLNNEHIYFSPRHSTFYQTLSFLCTSNCKRIQTIYDPFFPKTPMRHIALLHDVIIKVQIKENTNAPHHWPLCGEFIMTLLCRNYAGDKHITVCPRHDTAISEYIYEYPLGTLHVCTLMGDIVKTAMPPEAFATDKEDDCISSNILKNYGYIEFSLFSTKSRCGLCCDFKFDHHVSFVTVVQYLMLCFIG